MSQIKGKHTSPEIRLRKLLWHAGLRYGLHCPLPGKPDITFTGARLAVFVDGCFWHKCPIHLTMPKSHAAFWKDKLRKNVERDKINNRLLKQRGWRVLRFWEHEVRSNAQEVADIIIKRLSEQS